MPSGARRLPSKIRADAEWRFVYRVDRKLRALVVEEVLFLGE
jgi:hypothetical protein